MRLIRLTLAPSEPSGDTKPMLVNAEAIQLVLPWDARYNHPLARSYVRIGGEPWHVCETPEEIEALLTGTTSAPLTDRERQELLWLRDYVREVKWSFGLAYWSHEERAWRPVTPSDPIDEKRVALLNQLERGLAVLRESEEESNE